MLSFVSWQDDSSAESDDDDVEVSQRLQAQFVTFIDYILYFFQLYFTNGQEFRLLSLKENAQLSFLRVSDSRSVGHVLSFQENWS